MSLAWRIAKTCLHVAVPLVVLLILGGFFIFVLWPAADIWFVWRIYRGYIATIANLTGINSYLVTAAAILVFVPFYRAVTLVLYHPFNSHKRWLGIGMLLVIAVAYNGSLYWVTKDATFGFATGATLKFYAVTPTGVKFYDRPGFDPDSGMALKPVTPENIRDLRLLEKGDGKAVDPAVTRFFNPNTGAPELWFYKHEEGGDTFFVKEHGGFEFFNRPGFHPGSGAALQPVTPAIYVEWKKAHDAAEKVAREKAKKSAELRRSAEITCQKEAAQRAPKTSRSGKPPTVYPIGTGVISAWAFATSNILNVQPSYDWRYEECVRRASKVE